MQIRSPLLTLALATTAACGDLATETARLPSELRIEQQTVTTFAGESVSLRVTVLDQNGNPIPTPGWAAPVWSSSAPQTLGVEGARLTALAPGEATARVELAGLRGSATVRVNPHQLQLRLRGAYLTQSIQNLDGSVPLVQGRDALLRVFVTGDQPAFFAPKVRATLFHAGTAVRTFEMERTSDAVPMRVDQLRLASSWNVLVPGSLLVPGASLVVEADPDGRVPLAAGSQTRFPASGALALDVRAVPKLWVRMIPVFQTAFGTTGRVSASTLGEYAIPLLGKFPVAASDIDVRAPYTTNARLDTFEGWIQLLEEIEALRRADGSARYYYGVVTHPGGSGTPGGVGYVGWPAAIGYDRPGYGGETFAHELGHNFGLPHAPCGGPARADPNFPYFDGGIGVFGYDLFSQQVHDPAVAKDLMTYCSPEWISDYNYVKVLNSREKWDWTTTGPDRAAAAEPALLVWGGVRGGRLVLEPAFELAMRPSLPEGRGPYRVEGYDEAGGLLFSYAFQGREIDHVAGARGFSFAIPARIAHPDRLARLRLVGPEGAVERRTRGAAVTRPALSARTAPGELALDWTAEEYPMALVRDARTGQVLSFARGGVSRIHAPGAQVEILLSDGVRTVRPDVRVR